MTWVDFAVLGVLLVSAIHAFMRGLVRELLGIGAWIAALAAAAKGLPYGRNFAGQWITAPRWVDPVTFVVIFLAALIVLSLVARRLANLVRESALGGIDRSLGVLFGLARGAALVICAYIIAGMTVAVDHWPEPARNARLLPWTHDAARWVIDVIPPEYRPRLTDPPAPREATAGALLQAAPQGVATGRGGR